MKEKKIVRQKKFSGYLSFLSNFYEAWVCYDGNFYPSAENAYQASKFKDKTVRHFFTWSTPRAAKFAGKDAELSDNWEEIKISIMRDILISKFKNRQLRAWLFQVNDEDLVEENNHGDIFWGTCKGVGENHLGKLLQEVKDYYLDAPDICEVEYNEGDIFTDAKGRDWYILHSLNCFNTWGAGFALSAKSQLPELYTLDMSSTSGDKSKLGNFIVSDKEKSIGLYGQFTYGNLEGFLDRPDQPYMATKNRTVALRLKAIKLSLERLNSVIDSNSTVAMPAIGAGLAGLPWRAVESILEDVCKFKVVVFLLPDSKILDDIDLSDEPPTVVNYKNKGVRQDEYIGRGTLYGNPFIIGEDGERDVVIEKYRSAMEDALREGVVTEKDILYLGGKNIACGCKPQACHGDVLVDLFNLFR